MGSLSAEEIQAKLETVLAIMKDSVHKPLKEPVRSIGGLLGGEAKKVADHSSSPNSVCGSMLSKAIAYSMAVLEVNASMGLIVAAPTAGSSGVLPGVLLALEEVHALPDNSIYDGLLNASAIGYILMRMPLSPVRKPDVRREVGAASAMAASAVVESWGNS